MPTAEEAAAFGLTVEEASPPPVEVWPDCVESINLFESLHTNWRRGGCNGARTGLDYGAVHAVLVMRQIPKKKWAELFDDIRVMEDAALDHLSKQK